MFVCSCCFVLLAFFLCIMYSFAYCMEVTHFAKEAKPEDFACCLNISSHKVQPMLADTQGAYGMDRQYNFQVD